MRPDTEKGMVLLMVLVLLAGLSLMLAEFSRLLLTGHSVSAVSRTMLSSKQLIASCEKLAAQILLQKNIRKVSDSMFSPWVEDFPELLAEISADLESGEIAGEILDENSRFPLPAMFARNVKEQAKAHVYATVFTRLVARLLLLRGMADSDSPALEYAEAFTEALLRWGGDVGTDPDEDERQRYIEGTPSFVSPGVRLLSPDELLLVRWQHLTPRQARELIMGDDKLPGLIDLVSVWSTGPMNINTLQPIILESLVPSREKGREFARLVQERRSNPESLLEENWYREAALKSVQSSDEFPFACLGVKSSWFRVSLSVNAGAAQARCIAICRVSANRLQWVLRTFY